AVGRRIWSSGSGHEEVEVVVMHHSLQSVSTRERMVEDFSSPRADGGACLGCWEYGCDDRAVAGWSRGSMGAAGVKMLSEEPKAAFRRKTSSQLAAQRAR